ncbi:RCC1 domain-containing protein [Candidatus Izemoplasma sp. B36]|uniref:RCC1 domain-containing protein n=1 Tax=Candidatus Izemoplasma sp. B36 TaxID=3242468 RepID=UPI003557D400
MKKIICILFLGLTLSLLFIDQINIKAYSVIETEEDYEISIDKKIDFVSMGLKNSIARDSNNNYYIWGEVNTYMGSGDKDYTPNLILDSYLNLNLNENETIIKSDLNELHSAILTSDYRLLLTGYNSFGEIGNGTNLDQTSYVCIDSYFNLNQDEHMIDFALGDYFSIAVTNQGSVFTWGRNESYQLGVTNITSSNLPLDITNKFVLNQDELVIKVGANYQTSYAVTNQGRLFSWGGNYYGELGSGNDRYDRVSIPTDITSNFSLNQDELIIDIHVGYRNAFAITNQNRIFSWGNNSAYILGVKTISYSLLPIDITPNFQMLSSNSLEKFMLAENTAHILLDNGDLYGWGSNYNGKIGDLGSTYTNLPVKVNASFPLESDELIIDISSSYYGSSVITNKGNIYVWGGEGIHLGITTDNVVITPTKILQFDEYNVAKMETPLETGFVAIDSDYHATVLVNNENEFYVWGLNNYRFNQITSAYKLIQPTVFNPNIDFFEGETVIDISLDYNFGAFITSEFRVFTWGSNQGGQLGNYTNNSSNYPIDITGYFNLEENEKIIDIELGNNSAIALSNLGNVFVWGDNDYYQLGFYTDRDIEKPMKVTSLFDLEESDYITTIVVSIGKSYAVSNMGKVFTWGSTSSLFSVKDFTEYEVKEMTSDFSLLEDEKIIELKTSGRHSLAKTSLGRIFAWGLNNHGQLGNGSYLNQTNPVDITNYLNLASQEEVVNIYVGDYNSLIQTSLGRVLHFGNIYTDQLGLSSSVDTSLPQDITSAFNLLSGEEIELISLADNHSVLYTSLGRIFCWGDNEYSQLGFLDDPYHPIESVYELTTDLNDIQDLQRVFIDDETNALVPYFELNLIFGYELVNLIESIEINGVQYSDISYEEGLVKVVIPNNNSLGDIVNFSVDSITFSNGIIYLPLSNNFASTSLIIDSEGPEIVCGYSDKLYIESGVGDNSLIYAKVNDDSLETITYTTTGTVLWDVPGTYQVEYQASDSTGNQTILSTEIVVIDEITTSNQVVNGYTVVNIEDIVYDETIDLNEVYIENASTIYYSNEDYDGYLFNQTNNDLTYTFNIGNETFILKKNVTYFDQTYPTFEINDLIIEAGIYSDIDWATKVENLVDEDIDNLVIQEVDDTINYQVPGVYQVTVSVSDMFGHITEETYNISVIDTISPYINFIPELEIEIGSSNIDFSTYVTDVFDYVDNDITVIETYDSVNYNEFGRYYVSVRATDASGNAKSDYFYVTVVDTISPTFSVDINPFEEGTDVPDWTSYAYDVFDNSNKPVTISLKESNVNCEVAGTYYVILEATDTSGNTTEKQVSVTIVESQSPTFDINDQEMEVMLVSEDYIHDWT